MGWVLVAKAMLVGLLIAAPVGPIGLLCMQRTLASGMLAGFLSGLGAASADAVYGAIGALGLVAVTQQFTALAQPMALAGALLLGWLSWQAWCTPLVTKAAVAGRSSLFFSTMLLTLANPMTILSFTAVFSSLGGAMAVEGHSAFLMVVGIFIGSALWWLMLALVVGQLRHRISGAWMQRISRGAAVLLALFAIGQLWVLFR